MGNRGRGEFNPQREMRCPFWYNIGMKSTFEITLKSLAIASLPEKRLPATRHLLTVELIWPKPGAPRKSASRQVVLKKGKADFSDEPWAKRILFRDDIDGHTAFAASLAEPVSLQKLHRLLQLTAKAVLKEGADLIDAALVSYGDIARAPVDALATMVAEKDAPRTVAQGILDWSDLPGPGETREVTIPLFRPKVVKKSVGSLTLVVEGQ